LGETSDENHFGGRRRFHGHRGCQLRIKYKFAP
jgi:hypothetical protein